MPKEIINNRYLVANQMTGEGAQPDEITYGEVGWDRMGSVQVGVLKGGDYDEKTRMRPGFFMDLDRDGINRLIRSLRKARDAAFGADA